MGKKLLLQKLCQISLAELRLQVLISFTLIPVLGAKSNLSSLSLISAPLTAFPELGNGSKGREGC